MLLPGHMTLKFFLCCLNFPLVSRHIRGFCLVSEPRGPAFIEHVYVQGALLIGTPNNPMG